MKSVKIFLVFLIFFSMSSICFSNSSDLLLKAENHIASGNFNSAMEILNSIEYHKNSDETQIRNYVKAKLRIAQIASISKNYSKAENACKKALKADPQNAEAKELLKSIKRESSPKYVLFFTDSLRFFPSLLKGALMTLVLVLVTMGVSPVGGLFIALGRISGFAPVSMLCWFIIWFFRGTPLLLQLFFIYYGLPALGITLSPISAALIGLGVNYSAYLAEIIRAGILSIDSGQMEAAKALGMTYSQAMRRVIIPQTYKRLIPPVGNEFIALIKDTALVSTISMVELMRSADRLFNTYFNINVLILAAVIYLLFTTVFTFIFENLEKRVGIYEKR
jgi:polar amino acid transport system permease protein